MPGTRVSAVPFRPVARVRACLADAARLVIERDVASDLWRERGGFLVGTVERRGHSSLFVDVRAAIPAAGADGGATWWKVTAAAWDHASRVRETRYPDLMVVGWYHSHPGIGCFFSGVDREMQRHVFPNRWNLAAVADPVDPRGGGLPGARRALRPGTIPFRWFVGPDSVPIAPPAPGGGPGAVAARTPARLPPWQSRRQARAGRRRTP